jgi:succinyl-diaminopimelate desuccinylase
VRAYNNRNYQHETEPQELGFLMQRIIMNNTPNATIEQAATLSPATDTSKERSSSEQHMGKTIIDTLADLVAFPTVSGDQEVSRQALDYIEDRLSERLAHIERFEWNGFEALYASPRKTKTPKVLLAAHVDVVTAPLDQFRLTQKDGKLYGRGVADMKFAIATYLTLLDELGENVADYDFGIMITADEELGGYNGVKRLVDAGYLPEAVVLPDGGGNWKLERAAKGMIRPFFTARGIPMHGSRTWEGESAIEKMMNFLRSVQYDIFSEQGPDTSTFNVGKIEGGNIFNQISDLCTADADIRPITNAEAKRILAKIDKLARAHDVTYELLLNESAIDLDLDNPLVKAYIASTEKVLGRPIETMKSYAGSDARHFAPHGIPSLVTYPEGGGHHSDNEWLSEKALYQYKDIVKDYLDTVARKGE